ncbi:MAG: protein-tyrosine-phosphatase [Alphaproteobacteria bacterium]|nr:protein-tyrosine-phosphatase [Alphaproteobacteria bacterium]
MNTTSDFAPFRTTICGIDELIGHCAAGVTHVLSILDPGWPEPEAFGSFDPHHRLELRFHDVIEPGPGALLPERRDVERLLAWGRDLDTDAVTGAHLLVHCHAGISRSTAATALILAQARPDRPADEAFATVLRLRPRAWPNLRILEFGDDILGRGGEIVAAAGALYRQALRRDPYLRDAMTAAGRAREVLAGSGP